VNTAQQRSLGDRAHHQCGVVAAEDARRPDLLGWSDLTGVPIP
jgi:hypothetical protein